MTLASVLLPERDCFTCKNQKEWGCEAPSPYSRIIFDDEALDRCPRRPFLEDTEWFGELFQIHQWLEKGLLPDPGGWRDQGVLLPYYMGVIDKAIADGQEAQRDARKRKQEAEARAKRFTGRGAPR